MAESIELENETTYKVTLKDGIQFSDGSPVKAENFVKAWNLAVEQAMLNAYFFEPIRGYAEEGVSEMEGLKVIDDKEEWAHNESATLVPNENYSGEHPAKNDGLKFVFYASQDAAYADLLAGNLDVLDAVPDSAFGTYESELGDRAVNQPAAIFQSFTIPQKLEHFSGEEGKLRRQAISMAINREEVTETIFQGTRTPATDFTSPVIDGHSDTLAGEEVLEFNPDKAKELWAQADAISPFTGQFTIAYNSDGGH